MDLNNILNFCYRNIGVALVIAAVGFITLSFIKGLRITLLETRKVTAAMYMRLLIKLVGFITKIATCGFIVMLAVNIGHWMHRY